MNRQYERIKERAKALGWDFGAYDLEGTELVLSNNDPQNKWMLRMDNTPECFEAAERLLAAYEEGPVVKIKLATDSDRHLEETIAEVFKFAHKTSNDTYTFKYYSTCTGFLTIKVNLGKTNEVEVTPAHSK